MTEKTSPNEDYSNLANNFIQAFLDLDDSFKEGSEAMKNFAGTVFENYISDALYKESRFLEKLAKSSFLTRWYYRMKYRKAKYIRIKMERYYKQIS